MFGGGGQPSGEDILEATKITATAFMEHYNKTVESCYNKCILKYTGISCYLLLSPVYIHQRRIILVRIYALLFSNNQIWISTAIFFMLQ